MKLVMCILPAEWGQAVKVAGKLMTIPVDGSAMEVTDDQAAALLANSAKWRDPDNLPGSASQAKAGAGRPILTDAQGFELSEEETDAALAAVKPEPEATPELEPAPEPESPRASKRKRG